MTTGRVNRRRVNERARSSATERGSVTLELAVLFPLILSITFGVIEGAHWYHARSIALAAAEEGVRVATADGGSVAAGLAKAEQFAAQLGSNGLFSNVSVHPSSSATEITFTVTGQSLTLFPGWTGYQISQTASGPVERFTSPG